MNASFNRLGITLTPALIIPIKGGDYFRFRLGAGPGLYTAARMKVEASGAGGEDFKLGYTSAIGIHSSLVFESNFSERGSFSMGLKYYHVNYNYSVNNSTGWTTDPKAAEPNGSGLDFMIGYYFRF
jgi:hypothetical protein